MDTAPTEPTVQRHRRAVTLIVLAVAVMVSASVAYLHPTQTSQPAKPASVINHQLPLDTSSEYQPPVVGLPLPRSAGLLREGATSAVIQLYGDLSDRPPLGLHESVSTSNSTGIAQLVDVLNALPAYPRGIFCPFGDGSFFEVVLSYADGTTTSAEVEANGCQAMYVGRSEQPVAWAVRTPGLFDRLRAMLGRQPGPQYAPLS